MRSILALAPLILVPACGEDTAPQDSAPEAYDQVWVHVIEGCVPEPEANCEPSLHLCVGGRAYTQVTDSVNIGSWSAGDGAIVTTFPDAPLPRAGPAMTDDTLLGSRMREIRKSGSARVGAITLGCGRSPALRWLFAGSTEGAHRAATLLGVVATCRNLGVNIEAYLTWAFVRLGTHRARYNLPASQLTPAAYKAQLSMARPPPVPDG